MSQFQGKELSESQKNSIIVLAKAVTDEAFLKELRADPKTVLKREGVTAEEYSVPDDDCLNRLNCILNCLGDVWEKRS
jgi:hypothetical protein